MSMESKGLDGEYEKDSSSKPHHTCIGGTIRITLLFPVFAKLLWKNDCSCFK